MSNFFNSPEVVEAINIMKTEFPIALWETFYVTVL